MASSVMVTVFFCAVLFCLTNAQQSNTARNILILNALDGSQSFSAATKFAAELSDKNAVSIHIFAHKDRVDGETITSTNTTYSRYYYQSQPLPDRSVGRLNLPVERVTAILESLSTAVEGRLTGYPLTRANSNSSTVDANLVALSFSENNVFVADKHFMALYGSLKRNSAQVLLPGKTRRLTSPSDWHDLMVVGLALRRRGVRKWFDTFKRTFLHHATNREAFTLLDPRPALLEASVQFRNVTVGYLTNHDICVVTPNVTRTFGSMRKCSNDTALHLICKGNGADAGICSTIEEPRDWILNMNKQVGTYLPSAFCRSLFLLFAPLISSAIFSLSLSLSNVILCRQKLPATYENRMGRATINYSLLLEDMWHGSLRFFGVEEGSNMTKKFCWETGLVTTK
jgi:hypothetical protein